MPDALSGLWPKNDDGVKLSDLFGWFDCTHFFEQETQSGYLTPDKLPIGYSLVYEPRYLRSFQARFEPLA